MATVFWDRKGALLVVFMNPGATIISKVYCVIETIKERDSRQTAWPTDFGCHVVACHHVTPHCCPYSPVAQAMQVRIVLPSAI